ncbi:MAG: phospho-N-acetylmuramoyl-pentapeptide-transferase [Clostridiales bacterium]|nr:phospho-N-acetylmuramoyl-pentapeptide-transferase [Clostridiales bacterium]
MTIKFLICGLFCLLFSLLVAPVVLWFCKKLKASQTILHYVDKHSAKQGTPTMGGIVFVLTLLFASCFLFAEDSFLAWFCLAVTIAYALLGFLDDFIKVRYHHNLGLRAYQKMIGQVGISLIVGVYLYLTGRTTLSFFSFKIDISFWVIPLTVLVLVATTNSVNLTDGLDGLAGGVSLVYILIFGIILALLGSTELNNLAMLCFGLCGGILGFLVLNSYPAKIFMGDTGSLALGGFIGGVAVLSGLELLLPIMGIMFVLSAVSDIIQVVYFKKTKKRVFLMAPLHHHFEQKGVHENKIVASYVVVTTIVSLTVLIFMLLYAV